MVLLRRNGIAVATEKTAKKFNWRQKRKNVAKSCKPLHFAAIFPHVYPLLRRSSSSKKLPAGLQNIMKLQKMFANYKGGRDPSCGESDLARDFFCQLCGTNGFIMNTSGIFLQTVPPNFVHEKMSWKLKGRILKSGRHGNRCEFLK